MKLHTSLVCLCGILLAGCGAGPGVPEGAPATELPRLVVLAPAAAEMLEAIDLLDAVVGIGAFGPWPAPLRELPVVGDFDRPNVEAILALDCDVLISATSVAAADVHRKLESLGVEILELDTSTYDGVFASLRRLGERFGRVARADERAAAMRSAIDDVERRAAGLPRRSVLFVVGRDPLFVAGPGSHLDVLIGIAGGTNIAADAGAPYAQVSLEAMLGRRPEVILDMAGGGDWERWSFLPAVREGRVRRVDPAALAIPGLRLPEMARIVASLIHPEEFGEYGASP